MRVVQFHHVMHYFSKFFSIFCHVFPLVIFGFNFVTISIRGVC